MTTPNDPPLSRRAARQAQQESEVAFRTEVRQRVPHYDIPTEAQHSGAAPSTPSPVVPPSAPTPAAPAAHYSERVRRRDFRPPTEQAPAPSAAADVPLEYRTHGTEAMDALRASLAESSSPAPAPEPHVISEHTLSRRELRAQREQAAGAQQQTPPPLVEPAHSGPVNLSPSVAPTASPTEHGHEAPSSAQAHHSALGMQQPATTTHVAPSSWPPAPVQQPEPANAVPPAPPAPLAPAPAPAAASPATGNHWSVGIHDDEDPFENTFSREVGSSTSATNTNALVLPTMPTGSIAGPVTGTGEIIITGMIDLPRVVSATGTMPTVHDSADIDDLLDPSEIGVVSTDSAPVSALKAVSSHTPTHSVMTGKRSSSNMITTVLVATTVVMAVVAIGLFVVAAANGLF